MARWYFARHCESVGNRNGVLAGQLDFPLTWYGYVQCVRLTGVARRLGVSRVIASDLRRALRTAAFARLGSRADFSVSGELRERCLGTFEGVAREALARDGVLKNLRTWDYRPPNGESRKEAAMRAASYLSALSPDRTTLVVSHATVLSALLGLIEEQGPPDTPIRLNNGEVVARDVDETTWERVASRCAASEIGR